MSLDITLSATKVLFFFSFSTLKEAIPPEWMFVFPVAGLLQINQTTWKLNMQVLLVYTLVKRFIV